MHTDNQTVETGGFARFLHWAITAQDADIPLAVQQRMVLVMADDIAAAVSAVNEPEIRQLSAADADDGLASASLFQNGRPRRSARRAAVVNSIAGGWSELDTGYRMAVCHANLYVWPLLSALAESRNASAAQTLRAASLAYETTVRFARCWRMPSPMRIHPHALYSTLGATAAVGFLLELDARTLARALTAACTLGMTGPFSQAAAGALIRNAWSAAGVSNALLCVEWAQAGIGGVDSTPDDLYQGVLGAAADPTAWQPPVREQDWAVQASYHKRYSCCQYLHSSIEALLQLLEQYPALVGGEGAQSLDVRIHPLGLGLSSRDPGNTLAGRFSLPHAMAVSWAYGRADAQAFGTPSLTDERVLQLRQKIRVAPFEPLGAWPNDRPAGVTLTLTNGRQLHAECLSARGGADRPLAAHEIWEKVGALTKDALPGLLGAFMRWESSLAQPRATAPAATWNELLTEVFAPACPGF